MKLELGLLKHDNFQLRNPLHAISVCSAFLMMDFFPRQAFRQSIWLVGIVSLIRAYGICSAIAFQHPMLFPSLNCLLTGLAQQSATKFGKSRKG